MRGRASVWSRTERLAQTACRPDDLDALAHHIAAELGVSPEEVRAGAAEVGERRRAAGAVTVEEAAAFVGAELGMTAREVIAETRALLAAVR